MQGVPRYYDDILKAENPDLFEQIKEKRRKYLEQNRDEFTHERLLSKHKIKKARVALREDRKL